MSWPTQPKVRLAVTRFKPADTPVAGLSDEQRAALRERRTQEQTKVEPATEWVETRLFSGRFVEVQTVEPCSADCQCELCKGIAERLGRKRPLYDALYIKQRRQADGI